MAPRRAVRRPGTSVEAHHAISITYYRDGTAVVTTQHRGASESRYSFEEVLRMDAAYLGRRVAYADLKVALEGVVDQELDRLARENPGQMELDLGF